MFWHSKEGKIASTIDFWQTSSKRQNGNPDATNNLKNWSNMRLHTTYNDLIIGFTNLGCIESVVRWYSKTTTYDVSHMRLYAIYHFMSSCCRSLLCSTKINTENLLLKVNFDLYTSIYGNEINGPLVVTKKKSWDWLWVKAVQF